jgi:hypothetical protein
MVGDEGGYVNNTYSLCPIKPFNGPPAYLWQMRVGEAVIELMVFHFE